MLRSGFFQFLFWPDLLFLIHHQSALFYEVVLNLTKIFCLWSSKFHIIGLHLWGIGVLLNNLRPSVFLSACNHVHFVVSLFPLLNEGQRALVTNRKRRVPIGLVRFWSSDSWGWRSLRLSLGNFISKSKWLYARGRIRSLRRIKPKTKSSVGLLLVWQPEVRIGLLDRVPILKRILVVVSFLLIYLQLSWFEILLYLLFL